MIDFNQMGKNIRQERKRQHMTIEQLAETAQISDNFLGKIERGQSIPSLQTIDSIAWALNVSIDFLLGNPEQSIDYKYINSLMEINDLSQENKARFLDFIHNNIKYFK